MHESRADASMPPPVHRHCASKALEATHSVKEESRSTLLVMSIAQRHATKSLHDGPHFTRHTRHQADGNTSSREQRVLQATIVARRPNHLHPAKLAR